MSELNTFSVRIWEDRSRSNVRRESLRPILKAAGLPDTFDSMICGTQALNILLSWGESPNLVAALTGA